MITHLRYTQDARAKFVEAYGNAMMAWSSVEEMLFQWFMVASQLEEVPARSLFYSARSFVGRRDMLRAIIPHSPLDELTREYLKACLKKAGQYASFRNMAAHGTDRFKSDQAEPVYVLADPKAPEPISDEDAVTIEQLNRAAENFFLLRALMFDVHPDSHVPVSSPSAYLPLVRGMPSEPDSKESTDWIFEEWPSPQT